MSANDQHPAAWSPGTTVKYRPLPLGRRCGQRGHRRQE